jgi:hypothetical protein
MGALAHFQNGGYCLDVLSGCRSAEKKIMVEEVDGSLEL